MNFCLLATLSIASLFLHLSDAKTTNVMPQGKMTGRQDLSETFNAAGNRAHAKGNPESLSHFKAGLRDCLHCSTSIAQKKCDRDNKGVVLRYIHIIDAS